MNLEKHLQELDEQGYTILPGFLERDTTAAIRDFMDGALADGQGKEMGRGSPSFHQRICHPIEDPIIVRLATDARMLDVAARCLRAQNLRLRQQMFMLTLPCGDTPPSAPAGWHIDTPFLSEEWHDTPRKTYLQVFCYCTPVRSGGAATMVVPGSHHLTYVALEKAGCQTEEERWESARNIIQQAGVDTSAGIELTCEEGDVALFQPMLLHSGSKNVTDRSRYVFHCSFHDHSAERVRRLSPGFYDVFPASMERAMPAELRPLLER